jgi:hypothetical protein
MNPSGKIALIGAIMKQPIFRLSRVSGSPVKNEELLSDLSRVAETVGSATVPQKLYGKLGTYDYSTLIRRFGSWNKALLAAGLSLSNRVDIPDDELFENLFRLWEHYGRQPRRRELAQMPSTISQTPYNRRFGSWTSALEAFVEYANAAELESSDATIVTHERIHRKTGREPSLRLRWRVLQRDRFTCCGCGASPALTPGVVLHVDHIIAWSNDGETVIENLQTLCSECNLGKSNE